MAMVYRFESFYSYLFQILLTSKGMKESASEIIQRISSVERIKEERNHRWSIGFYEESDFVNDVVKSSITLFRKTVQQTSDETIKQMVRSLIPSSISDPEFDEVYAEAIDISLR
jgi:hypothetical protein